MMSASWPESSLTSGIRIFLWNYTIRSVSSFGRVITDSDKYGFNKHIPDGSNVRCLELTCAQVMSYQDFNGLLQSFVGNGRRLVREPSGIQCCALKCSPPIGQSYEVLLTFALAHPAGNSFLFMCFAFISIGTGHPFWTIISSVFTLHFSWYILFIAAGGRELEHVGVLAAELQVRCTVFHDLNTIWVNVTEEILQVLLVLHAVKHHVHDSNFPFHLYRG